MKAAWNRGDDSDVTLVMERTEETTAVVDWDDAPATERCVYVQDEGSQRWSARALKAAAEQAAYTDG